MNQRDHQQQSQCDEYGNLTIGLDAADSVDTLYNGVSTACQTEVVGDGSTGHHAEDSDSGVTVAAACQNQLTQGAAAQQHGTPANNHHAQEVPQVCAVGNGLALEAQLEAAGDEVADKVSPDIERRLLETVDEIQQRLLLPEKSTAKQICKEVTTWQQQASGPSKDG